MNISYTRPRSHHLRRTGTGLVSGNQLVSMAWTSTGGQHKGRTIKCFKQGTQTRWHHTRDNVITLDTMPLPEYNIVISQSRLSHTLDLKS